MLARHGIAWDFSANSEKAARDPQIPDLAHVHKSGTSLCQTAICMFACHCSDDCSRMPKERFCSEVGLLRSRERKTKRKRKRKIGRKGLLALSIIVVHHIGPYVDECIWLASEASKVLASS